MTSLSGTSFRSASVSSHYIHRPPYAQQVYPCILEHAPATERLLDLGCGEGKIARHLAPHFVQVVAVDPASNMIGLGKTLENGRATNIVWVEATAEDAPLSGSFDVVTFASSVHWMDPTRLFSALRQRLRTKHLLAFIDGDLPFEPPWQDDWQRFLKKWVPEITGRPYGSKVWNAARTRHLDHVDVIQIHAFISDPVQQSVDEFISCQHSRDTFALHKLGARVSEFRQELGDLLTPHADASGDLTFQVNTSLTLAKCA